MSEYTLQYTADEIEQAIGSSLASLRVLQGKKIIAIGDSFVKGHTMPEEQTWVSRIAQRNGMTKYVYATNGVSLAQASGQTSTALVNTLFNITANVKEADYIVLLAGHNDANPKQNGGTAIPIGENTDTVRTTFKGALNVTIQTLLNAYPNAKMLFLTPFNRYGIEEPYAEAMKEICGIWCVPCFDNYHSSGICFQNEAQATVYELSGSLHLNEAGQERISLLYESLLANHLPVSYSLDSNTAVESIEPKVGQYIHMSFDDVTNVIDQLAAGTLASAFDNSFLAMLKNAHDKYGFVFSLYLQSIPTSISTKYQTELRNAASWLKWGLHSLNGGNYQSASYANGKADWNKMVNTVLALTGSHDAVDRMPRLHQFYGSEDALKGMRDASLGALGFLSTDDTRDAYYLDTDRLDYLYEGENDHLTDFKNGLVFYRTDLRLDWFSGAGFTYNAAAGMSNHTPTNSGDIVGELERRYNNALYINTWGCYVIFTHEWQPASAIQSALNTIGEFAVNHGISFDFPQNRTAHITPMDIPAVTVASGGGSGDNTGGDNTGGDNTGGDNTVLWYQDTTTSNAYTGNADEEVEVKTSFDELVFSAKSTISGGAGGSYETGGYIKSSTGRSTHDGYCLAVNGGETLTLNQNVPGVTLAYAVYESVASPLGMTNAAPNGQVALVWLSDSVVLQQATKYICVAFKNGDGSTDFTAEQLALLPSCISITTGTDTGGNSGGERETVLFSEQTDFEVGTGIWTGDSCRLDSNNARLSADIHDMTFSAGDIISIGDYTVYKFAIGTNNAASSTNGQLWIGGGYKTADYTLCSTDVDNMKVLMIARVDNANITDDDIAYINANAKILRVSPIIYSVTNNFTNASTNYNMPFVAENKPYTAIITADEGYALSSVQVTMGGVDVTASVWNAGTGTVSIPQATGNIVITAVAAKTDS